MTAERLTQRALNRALLARQGLLEPLRLPLVEAVEAIGALQTQYWPSLPVALWARLPALAVDDVYAAFDTHRLLLATLLRGTLHVVSAGQYPQYAVVTEESGSGGWERLGGPGAPVDVRALGEALAAHAERCPLRAEDCAAFLEARIAERGLPAGDPWLARMRQYGWRPFRRSSWFVRVPVDGRWGPRAPEASLAAHPLTARPWPAAGEALDAVVRSHLRAFGPAGAEDVAAWIGWRTPPVRTALEALGPELVRFQDDAGRTLFDLLDAPRPDADTPAPVRFLPAFDSTLLAYASRRRQRIVPDAHRDGMYLRANLQVLATFLVDGLVAGTWSLQARRREATLSLRPLARLDRGARAALLEEGERLARFGEPAAAAHRVTIEP